MNSIKHTCFLCLFGGLFVFATGLATAADDAVEPVGLLTQKDSKLVERSALDQPLQKLATLNDGDSKRFVPIELQPGVAFDLTYRLPAVATCEELVVTADARRLTKRQLPRVEVLVSTLSAQSGFQTVRSLVLKATNQPQKLPLPASAARWIIVRLTSPAEAITLPVAEFDVRGHDGPPESRYAFKEAPVKAFKVLAEVQKSVGVEINKDEAALYRDAADGKLDDWSFAEAALLSSGVTDADARRKYLDQIEQITKQAKAAVSDAKTPYEKGELLLKWLHQNAMSSGYQENQTDLATVLETGKFNCVSSATLYNIVGRRLALDLRAIEVPDHAFAILYVGAKHADVETTNAAGFNPARDRRILERITKQTGFHYIPDRHADKRREVKDTGLLALTCYNHGVFHSRKKEYAEALADYFRSLSLDPEFPSAIQNVLGVFANWSKELGESNQFEQAVVVVSAGLRLAPEDKNLLHNRKVVWQQWALAEIEDNRRDAALDVLTRAVKEVPGGGFDRMQAYVFIQPGEKLAESKKWTDAIALATGGLKLVPPVAQQELRDWRKSVYHRWSDSALKINDFAAAADVLALAMQAEPNDRQFSGNTAYVVQEWLAKTQESDGLVAAESLLTRLAARFKAVKTIGRVFESFLGRATETLAKGNKNDEALALVTRHQELLRDNIARDLRRAIFDRQATKLTSMKKWEDAIAVYQRGLTTLSNDSRIRNNLMATWDMWAATFRKSGDWSAAAEIYGKALDSGISNNTFARKIGFSVQELALNTWKKDGSEAAEKQIAAWRKKRPDVREVKNAALAYVQTVAQKQQKDGKHEQALITVDRCRPLLDKTGHERLARFVCDTWARPHIQKKEWMLAIDVYAKGLKSLPNDSHLKRNATVTWNKWGGIFVEQKKWDEAIKVYQQALKQFPNDSRLKNNLKYCQKQAGK